jgi:hypothetical protein
MWGVGKIAEFIHVESRTKVSSIGFEVLRAVVIVFYLVGYNAL